MKFIAPLLLLYALLQFTTPNGFPIWINRDQVVAVVHASEYDCKDGAKAKVIYGTAFSCVKETPEEVAKKLTDVQ